jgi:hypothetical protein
MVKASGKPAEASSPALAVQPGVTCYRILTHISANWTAF